MCEVVTSMSHDMIIAEFSLKMTTCSLLTFLLEHLKTGNSVLANSIKEYVSGSFTNYNYVGNTKVSVSIKKNLCQQMHIKRDISN